MVPLPGSPLAIWSPSPALAPVPERPFADSGPWLVPARRLCVDPLLLLPWMLRSWGQPDPVATITLEDRER